MSNWFAYHHQNRQPEMGKQKKPAIFISVSSFFLILLGIGLILSFLNRRGIHPLGVINAEHGMLQSGNFHPCVTYWEDEILNWAGVYDLDPLLIATVMQIESCGDPQAISPAGAQGLFQVMPYHFQPGEDPLDPQTNAKRGLAYLHEALQIANGDIQLALAGYNGGHGQIDRNPANWPDETRRYVHWGYGIYHDAVNENIYRENLSDWLRAGGSLLCNQAEINQGSHQ